MWGLIKNVACAEDIIEFGYQAVINPIKVTVIVRSFKWVGRKDSSTGRINNQFRLAPPMIAIALRDRAGILHIVSLSLIWCNGREEDGLNITAIINRVL